MPHGHPDWGVRQPTSKIYSMLDQGELAVRLGAITSVDRLGNVLVAEDFRCGLARSVWKTFGVGGSGGVTTVPARFSGHSAWISSGTGATPLTQLNIKCPYTQAGNLGFEMHEAHDISAAAVWSWFQAQGGGYTIVSGIRVEQATGELSVHNHLGAWELVTDEARLENDSVCFNVVKFVVDIANRRYVRARVNDLSWDLSAYAPVSFASDLETWVEWRGIVEGSALLSGTMYVGGVVITENEP